VLEGRYPGDRKLSCAVSDGASACFGAGIGVKGRLRDALNNPRLPFTWCPPHRVNLSLADANAAGGEPFEKLECMMRDVHNYLSNSPKRRQALIEVCNALGQSLVKVTSWGETRWSSR
jgi:hypothetical protein